MFEAYSTSSSTFTQNQPITFENIRIKSTNVIDLIDKGISDIENGKTLSKERLNSIRKAVSDTRNLVNKANEDYPKVILPAINQGISDIGSLLNNGTILLNGIKDCVPDLKSIISLINEVEIPENMTANLLLDMLNILLNKQEYERIIKEIDEQCE